MPLALSDTKDQEQALRVLVKLVQRSVEVPAVIVAARQITSDCPKNNDECELQAIYNAVKHGTTKVKCLKNGLRYVADPVQTDWFQTADRTLKSCIEGACAGDCDEHAVLVAALAGALGFSVGLRIWGHTGGDFEHIYACVGLPKHEPPTDPREWLGMDTTVDSAAVGWDPPRGMWATAIAISSF